MSTPIAPYSDQARSDLRDCAIGHTLHYHESIDSTMAEARRLAERGDAPSGTIVVADLQTTGRGRLQRTWQAPAGRALLMSIVLTQDHMPSEAGHLPMIAGLAVLHAVDATLTGAARAGLKWPNDVVIAPSGGAAVPLAMCKVAGILVESTMEGGRLLRAVLGIGVNVNQSATELPRVDPPALPPASIAETLGRNVDRAELLVAVARGVDAALHMPAVSLVEAWRQNLWTLGRQVTAHLGDGNVLVGRAVDVTASGALVIDTGAGRQIVEAGDVTLRGDGQKET